MNTNILRFQHRYTNVCYGAKTLTNEQYREQRHGIGIGFQFDRIRPCFVELLCGGGGDLCSNRIHMYIENRVTINTREPNRSYSSDCSPERRVVGFR